MHKQDGKFAEEGRILSRMCWRIARGCSGDAALLEGIRRYRLTRHLPLPIAPTGAASSGPVELKQEELDQVPKCMAAIEPIKPGA